MTSAAPLPKPGPAVVGIGASAGGLAALKAFFSRVTADCGLAFVVVVHLSPEHKSHLAELLQPSVPFPIQQVTETTALEPNHVYVIPPNANINTIDTHLRLSELETQPRQRAPIDHFFRTLASAHDGRAIGVILTGTGTDGTLGLKDIKAKGGVIIVQDPNEAEYDGMPQSAIATGLVDRILPVAEIPDTILRLHQTEPRLPAAEAVEEVSQGERAILQKVFALLHARTDRDFTQYKRSTVLRRIGRRMQLNYLEDFESYLDRLREQPDEVRALGDDLLITVTQFFRDPEVFNKLAEEEIPRLFQAKGPRDAARVWSVGCATGEEAYSLAMLLVEEAGRHDAPPQIQLFASDLHGRSLDRAREGFYPGDIEADVSPERLRRFFLQENGGYRIRKEIRDLVVFAPHNLLGDPPFSKLDLISCRNLLIYLERDIQRDVVELFHYALNPEGTLVLGSAETIDAADLFRTEDKKLCLFRKRNVPAREPRLPVFPLPRGRFSGETGRAGPPNQPPSYGSIHQRMVEQYAPPSILISPDNKLIHLSEHAGRYLVHPGGEPTASVFKLVREELRVELQSALQACRETKEASDSEPVPVRFNGHSRPVVLHVRPALDPNQEGFALIIFEEREPPKPGEETAKAKTTPDAGLDPAQIQNLEDELALTRQRLQSIVEEYETSQEEMKASNEELQSANEELRSTMEELETSKEELQSINEELQTVNQQNRHKVEELAQLTGDLQNLLTATDIATLFLNRDQRILRFTPKLSELFNVRPADRGRPISDFTNRLGYPDLRADADAVLRHLVPIEREVQDEIGCWYLTRVLPYRTTDDRIGGVVITFTDITTRKRSEAALRASEERLLRMVNIDGVGVLIFDASGFLIDGNDAFLKMCGYSRQDVAAKTLTWRTLTPPEYVDVSEQELRRLGESGRIGPYEKEYLCKDGSRLWMVFVGASLGDGTLVEYCIDIMDRKRAEQALREAKLYAESIVDSLHEPLLVLTHDLRVQSANPAFYRHFRAKPESTVGRFVYELGNGQWNIPALRKSVEEVLPSSSILEDLEVEHEFEEIGRRVMLLNARRLEGIPIILLGLRDITERKRGEEDLRDAERNLRSVNEVLSRVNANLKQFAFAASHDLREPLRTVSTYSQFLIEACRKGRDDDASAAVGFIVEANERMDQLLKDLLTYTQLNVDDGEPGEIVDLNLAIDKTLGNLKTSMEQSGAVVAHDVLPEVRGRESHFIQLFQNLIDNAIKYRSERPPEVRISVERAGAEWCFAVNDNGIGIDPAYQERIFEMFKRLHSRRIPGTGIGLAVCRRVLERSGGRIWVESAVDRGSTFYFTLPAITPTR